MLKTISPYFGQLGILFLIFLLVLVIPAFLHEHWDFFRPWLLTWKVRWLMFLDGMQPQKPQTGDRIELPWDNEGQIHSTLVAGVWVDDRLYYRALGVPLGNRPAGDDVKDRHPGIPDSIFGKCERCQRSWKWVDSHTTQYSPTVGMFALCVRDWNELSPQDRVQYYRKAWERYRTGEPESRWEEIKTAVLEGK